MPDSAHSALSGSSSADAAAAGEPRVRWLFLDLNSYFASVEQEMRPELRGRPVAVVPVMADTTCAIAASYEAKAFGVKTGTQVAEARRLCPGIQFVEARHGIYVDYHNRIVEAVQQCVPVSAVLSIDEMASSLIGREQPLRAALSLAKRIKQVLREQVGETLRCSIGLAPNRYLAKIASDMEKPDGLVALTPDLLPAALEHLSLRDLPGVGARMEKRLHMAGIRTMEQLLRLDREQMNHAWGSIQGEKLWHWLRGEDFQDAALEHQKSISQSHVLPPALRTPEGCYAVAHKLLHKAAMRLRAARLWTTSISVSVKFVVPKEEAHRLHYSGIPQEGWSQGMSVVECQDSQTLVEALCKLWERCPKDARHRKPFYVGVGLGNLVPDHLHTLDLFGNLEGESRRTRLTTAMDSLNHKYGLTTLMPASMLLARAAAPTRIAFTNIPDLFE
ncbi:DNA polymerase Y family protein [Silvibacterium sp.]|uniref:DNA polymerase Y family protein n=1 Tax=Silvibacterium sp. TaxID=1964179 RepID=UPI0039E5E82D